MKYELGDYVRFNKRWQKQPYPVVFEGEKDFFEYLDKHDLDEGVPMALLKKIEHIEQGFICGKINMIKTEHTLGWSEGTDVGIGIVGKGFYTSDEKYEDMYLVASRMNCIYRVSKEDIKLIKDNSELQ